MQRSRDVWVVLNPAQDIVGCSTTRKDAVWNADYGDHEDAVFLELYDYQRNEHLGYRVLHVPLTALLALAEAVEQRDELLRGGHALTAADITNANVLVDMALAMYQRARASHGS